MFLLDRMAVVLGKFKLNYESSMALDEIDSDLRRQVVQSLMEMIRDKTQPVNTADVVLALTCVRILSRGKASINVSKLFIHNYIKWKDRHMHVY